MRPNTFGGESGRSRLNQELREAFAEWLQTLSWDWFLTQTFEIPRLPHQSIQVLNRLAATLRHFSAAGVFLGTETHKSGYLHVHGLVRDPLMAIPWGPLTRALRRRYGRNKLERIHDVAKVASYCSKYVAKELTDYNIW